MRVLLSAYSCEPFRGSEPEVGWNWALQSSRYCETWVLTRAKSRAAIEAGLKGRAPDNLHFVYLDLSLRAWKHLPGGFYVYYILWQVLAYFKARRLHRKVRFDRVHHVTLGACWLPSLLALLPVPFVWGPVGGGESYPAAFRRTFSLRGRVFETLRLAAQRLASWNPLLRMTAKRAALTLATTEETVRYLRGLGCRHIEIVSQVGVPKDLAEKPGPPVRREGRPFRIYSAGRLLHWKGFHLALQALARARSRDSEYWILGDGPERARLERLARDLGLAKRVRFRGRLTRADVMAIASECDVLIHPSLHEAGGFVCAEAIAAGCAVLCLDLGGPALQVGEDGGLRIEAADPERTVAKLAEALDELRARPDLRRRLVSAGRERLGQFTWEATIARFREMCARAGLEEKP